jgi:hypothetical protein
MIDEGRADPVDILHILGPSFEVHFQRKPESGADLLRSLHADPDFAAARDERGRQRFTTRREEMQRLSNATRRGYDVPPAKEAAWRTLKRKRTLTNDEIGQMLGLKPYRKPSKKKRKSRNG